MNRRGRLGTNDQDTLRVQRQTDRKARETGKGKREAG